MAVAERAELQQVLFNCGLAAGLACLCLFSEQEVLADLNQASWQEHALEYFHVLYKCLYANLLAVGLPPLKENFFLKFF